MASFSSSARSSVKIHFVPFLSLSRSNANGFVWVDADAAAAAAMSTTVTTQNFMRVPLVDLYLSYLHLMRTQYSIVRAARTHGRIKHETRANKCVVKLSKTTQQNRLYIWMCEICVCAFDIVSLAITLFTHICALFLCNMRAMHAIHVLCSYSCLCENVFPHAK